MSTNAAEEFVEHVNEAGSKVLCAIISSSQWTANGAAVFHLPMYPTEEEYGAFLDLLNFEYNSGYGSQELFGTIWYYDGTWSDRSEYDGSEEWSHNECPPIPNVLRK